MDNDARYACNRVGALVREIELIFSASMSVEARHEGCTEGEVHKKFHLAGGIDVVTFQLGCSGYSRGAVWDYMPPLPADVYEGGCLFNQTVVVTGNGHGLTITAGVLGQPSPTFDDMNAFTWFDILVGSELAHQRQSLAHRALLATESVHNGRILEVPAATVDRITDQVRQSHQRHCA